MTTFFIDKKYYSLKKNGKKLLLVLTVFVVSSITYLIPDILQNSKVQNVRLVTLDKNLNDSNIVFNVTKYKNNNKNSTNEREHNLTTAFLKKTVQHSMAKETIQILNRTRYTNISNNSTTIATKNRTVKEKELKVSSTVTFKKLNSTLHGNDLKGSTMTGTVSDITKKNKVENLIYILQWNHGLLSLTEGNQAFIDRGCEYTNCFVTNRRDYLSDYTKFDVIIFTTPHVAKFHNRDLPHIRSPHQKFVFGSLESSAYYPICSNKYDGFFNWTWSFRLDSDARWVYINIRDMNGTIIGPKQNMHWIKTEDMAPVPKKLRNKLKRKKKLVAWVVSNCSSKNKREVFVLNLNKELKKHGYEVDIFGACGNKYCPYSCEELVANEYFFYLSFENSFNQDYVTEKILRGLNYDTVPVVYGGANYTRFMPDGIYLNARELGVNKLAAKMIEISKNTDMYIDLFKWRNHYIYETTNTKPDGNDYCSLCALFNDKSRMQEITVVSHFREWWDPPNWC